MYVTELTQVDSALGADSGNVEHPQQSASPPSSTPQDSLIDQGTCY